MNNSCNSHSSAVRKILTSSYKPSRVYGAKRKKAPPKRISFDVTFFNYPGETVFTKQVIKESELTKLGTGSVQLMENDIEETVKGELVNLLEQLTEVKLKIEDVILTFMKKEGRKREFRKHCGNSSFKYDAKGIKDMVGRDSKNLVIILGSLCPNLTPQNAGAHSTGDSTIKSSFKNTEESFDSSDDFSDDSIPNILFSKFPKSTPKLLKRKNETQTTSNTPATTTKTAKSDVPCKVSKKEVHNKLSDVLDEVYMKAYQTVSKQISLFAVLTMMRHVSSFMEALNICIEKKGINATELEHCLAQVMLLFENKTLNCWEIVLSELASLLKIPSNDSTSGNILLILIRALRNLDCEIWNDFFLTPCLSSEEISEYCSSSGCVKLSHKNTDCIQFDSNSNINELLYSYTSRKETKFLLDGYEIEKGETVWNRNFFHILPEILFVAITDTEQKNLSFPEEIKKIILEDIRSFNSGIFSLAGLVCTENNDLIIIVRHSKANTVKVYANGNIYFANTPLYQFVMDYLSSYQKVLLMYTDPALLQDDPNIDAINIFGKFLSDRLSAKQAVRTNEIIEIDDEGDRVDGEFDSMIQRLNGRLSAIKGQPELKSKIHQWARHVMMQNRKSQLGVATLTKSEISSNLHMILSGNPGTGKTMVARCMAGILSDIGLLATSEIVEVQRDDLVSGFIGDTAIKTKAVIKKAFGKLMFIDEAYQLCKRQTEKDFGKESLDTIMKYMNPSSDESTSYPVFVFAGYSSDMDMFLKNVNRGFRRRIKERFEFKDYSPLDLTGIATSKLLVKKFNYPYGVEELITEGFLKIPLTVRSEHNASLCEDLIKEIVMQQEARLSFDAAADELTSFTKEDIQLGISALLAKFKTEMKTHKMQDKSTQMPFVEVTLHIAGVGVIPGSPICF